MWLAGYRVAVGKGLSKGIYSTLRWRSPLVARRAGIPWRKRHSEADARLEMICHIGAFLQSLSCINFCGMDAHGAGFSEILGCQDCSIPAVGASKAISF